MGIKLWECKYRWKQLQKYRKRRDRLNMYLKRMFTDFKRSRKSLEGADILDFDIWQRGYGK